MKYCLECACGPVCCDYCKHYKFNGTSDGRYVGEGWCVFHQLPMDPGHVCDDYECSFIDKHGLFEGECE